MRRFGHALASLRWRLTLTFIALLLPLLVLLAGYQYLTPRASLISNRVSELQADFTSAKRLVAAKEKTAGRHNHGDATALRDPPPARSSANRAWPTPSPTVTGQTVQVVVYDRSLTQEAVMPEGADPADPGRGRAPGGGGDRGTRSSAQQITTSGGDQLVVGFPVVAGSGVCGVAQLSVVDGPRSTGVLHDEILLITAGGLVIPGARARARRAAHREDAPAHAPPDRYRRTTRDR